MTSQLLNYVRAGRCSKSEEAPFYNTHSLSVVQKLPLICKTQTFHCTGQNSLCAYHAHELTLQGNLSIHLMLESAQFKIKIKFLKN